MKTKGLFLGHCQACGMRQVVLPDAAGIAKHGYKVKGFGFFAGVCRGAHHQPLEVERTFLDNIVVALGDYAKRCYKKARELRSGKLTPTNVYARNAVGNLVYEYTARGKSMPREVTWSDATVIERSKGLEAAIAHEQFQAKQAVSHAKGLLELASRVYRKVLLQPRHLDYKPSIKVGDTVHLFGKSGFDVVVQQITDQVCHGCGPHMNGRRMPHISYERNGKMLCYPVRLIRVMKNKVDNGTNELNIPNVVDDLSTTKSKEISMASKAKKSAKAKTKTNGDKPLSKVAQAVAFMKGEVKKAGGLKKLEFGGRKTIIEAAAERFKLAVPTCATQYQKQVRAA